MIKLVLTLTIFSSIFAGDLSDLKIKLLSGQTVNIEEIESITVNQNKEIEFFELKEGSLIHRLDIKDIFPKNSSIYFHETVGEGSGG